MKVAVLTLTRDRLPYTQACFASLAENAGCDYDHYILDQGSTDGTRDWLTEQEGLNVAMLTENIGINRGINTLLDWCKPNRYDVIVKFDNDCELLTPDTLNDVCETAMDKHMVLSPRIHGLRNPVRSVAYEDGVDLAPHIGAIFMAVPAWIYQEGYRFRADAPLHGTDDSDLCAYWRSLGRRLGYLRGYDANHYLTTDGQHQDMPDYFARTLAEGKPSIL